MCCKEDKSQKKTLVSSNNQYKNIYAEGFKIEKHLDAKILEISNAWPQAEKTYKYLVLDNEQADKSMFNKEAYDGVIITPIDKIVVTSTTHLPALELLNVHESLVGFPGNDYVSSEKRRNQIDIKACMVISEKQRLDQVFLCLSAGQSQNRSSIFYEESK